jgi:hypothetical protein
MSAPISRSIPIQKHDIWKVKTEKMPFSKASYAALKPLLGVLYGSI